MHAPPPRCPFKTQNAHCAPSMAKLCCAFLSYPAGGIRCGRATLRMWGFPIIRVPFRASLKYGSPYFVVYIGVPLLRETTMYVGIGTNQSVRDCIKGFCRNSVKDWSGLWL